MIIALGKTNILPHVFAVLGVACGADTNCQDTREEDSAKSGMSQDVTPRQANYKWCKELVEHEYALWKYETTTKKTRSNFSSHHCSFKRCYLSIG